MLILLLKSTSFHGDGYFDWSLPILINSLHFNGFSGSLSLISLLTSSLSVVILVQINPILHKPSCAKSASTSSSLGSGINAAFLWVLICGGSYKAITVACIPRGTCASSSYFPIKYAHLCFPVDLHLDINESTKAPCSNLTMSTFLYFCAVKVT